MKNRYNVYKLFIFVSFVTFAIIRLKYNYKVVVNYVNLVSCMYAVAIVVGTLNTFYEGEKEKGVLITILHIVNALFFGRIIIYEIITNVNSTGQMQCYIDSALSDFYSIMALGISFSSFHLVKCLKCIVDWVDNLINSFK